VATYTLVRNNANLSQELFMPVANNVAAHGDLVAGFEALEQALGHGVGTDEGQRLLDQAEKHLKEAASRETRNPFVRMLLANCYFNQAQALVQSGQADEAKSRIQQFSEALKHAYREVDRTRLRHIQDEIKADYNLLVRKQYDEAIRIYETLAEVKDDSKLHIALRAHWMLAGIYSGDWGVDDSFVDPAKAREHLIQILAHWGDSSEAAFIRRSLRWSEEEGRNQFEYFPRENELNLAGLF
jgi:tetratricopeptide (TPR) repeat protein